MPFRTFTTGEVLTAANVQSYLMRQSVMVFANASARSSAITAPTQGMTVYMTDTSSLMTYSGSAWVNAINTASVVNNAITGAKVSTGFLTQYADLAIGGMNTSYNWYLATLPGGATYDSVLSVIPWSGTNDTVLLFAVQLGHWSGVQNPNQIRVAAALGNAVASTTGIFRIYYKV